MWSVYLLQCSDNSLYCGITIDLFRRLEHHNTSKLGAKYTRGRRPVTLVYEEQVETHPEALRREYKIKKLSKKEKLELVRKFEWRKVRRAT